MVCKNQSNDIHQSNNSIHNIHTKFEKEAFFAITSCASGRMGSSSHPLLQEEREKNQNRNR